MMGRRFFERLRFDLSAEAQDQSASLAAAVKGGLGGHAAAVRPPVGSLAALAAMVVVIGMVSLFAAIDLIVPGEVNAAIFYGLCLGLCAWTQSPRFLWAITAVCVILTFTGLAFGPAPVSGNKVLYLFWINRAFVAAKLLILSVCVYLWMHRSKQLRAASAMLRAKNEVLSENLHQARKLEAIGQLTEGIAHDFRNVLAMIISSMELIAADRGDEARRQRLVRAAVGAAQSATGLVQRLAAFAAPALPEQVQLEPVIRRMLPQWQRTLGEAVELIADLPRRIWPCRLEPAQFEAAILNLAINARDAMPNGGRLTIRAENKTIGQERTAGLSPGDYLLVSVSDNGPGIPADLLPKLFDPFFSTKGPGKGSGLGLWMVKNFATECGGAVLLDSAIGAGTTVWLYLPRA